MEKLPKKPGSFRSNDEPRESDKGRQNSRTPTSTDNPPLKRSDKEVTGSSGRPKVNYVDIPNLVRSIQRAEGNPDCFMKKTSCDEMDCIWRAFCLDPGRIRD